MSSKDYENIITILTKEILKKRLAIFIGAGCSMGVGLPSWKQLLENLIEEYGIKTKENNLLKLASRIERSIGRSNLLDEISETCRIQQKPESSTHKLLAELDVNFYITTNYDHLLEEAFRQIGIQPHVVHKDQDLPVLNPTAKTIVKLHGDIDSPSSLVCTERDYRRYRTIHQGFVEWLKAKNTELTILFIGTSFDDPRLVEADDHIIELFGKNKRNHVIALKKPEKQNGQDIDDFQAELEDFEDRCGSLESERGFLVLVIQHYGEIEKLLKEIKNRVLQIRIDEKKGFDQDAALYQLRAEHYETLGKKFSKHVDATVRELCDEIAGPVYFPSFSKVKNKIELLIERLQNPPHILSPETIVHGYLTLMDAFAATGKPEDTRKAMEFYEKANSALSAIREGHELALRMLRAKAKLLFFQGDFQSALETLQNNHTPKGIFWRLAILLASDKLDDAFSLIQKNYPIQPEWAGEAIRVFARKGDLEAAEALYDEFASKPDSFQDAYGFIRLQHQMALAYFHRAILLEGNPDLLQIIPGQLSLKAYAACQKALHYLNEIHKTHEYTDPNESLIFTESLITKMQVLNFIGETSQALDVAKNLLHFRPIPQAAAAYMAYREDPKNKDSLLSLVELISIDHPEEDWALVMRTRLLAMAGQYQEAWDLLFQAKAQILGEGEKREIAWTALEIGLSIGESEAAMTVVEELIDKEDLFYQFLFAKNLYFQEKLDHAYEILQNLRKSSLPPSAQSEILSLLARIFMKRKHWSAAKDLLKQAASKFQHPLILKDLIYVGFKEKDDAIVFEAANNLEQLGFNDEETNQAKAQAAFNLGRYNRAIETWKAIYKNDKSPNTSIKIANTLRAKGEYDKALEVLEDHIPKKGIPNYGCLGLYCTILELIGRQEDAFHQLDSRFEDIKDQPELLVMHLNLAYRENQEERANKSMQRLIELQKQGKVKPSLFRPGNIEDFKEMIEGSRKRREFAIEQYRLGRMPRSFLCEIENRPYYLDWAIRTQAMHLPEDPQMRLEYTIYSTNSFKTGLRGGKKDLISIVAPTETQEAVIDLSALITLHRLDLFPVIEKHFKAIHYPQAFHWLWELDRSRYTFHQRSKALLYREIDSFLTTAQIGRLELVRKQGAEDDPKRMIELARMESIPIITAWSKEEEWTGADEGVVIWISQIVNWLYKSGKIGEDKYRESLSLLKSTTGSNEQSPSNMLQLAGRLLFDRGAIEFLVGNGLLDPLLSMGVRPVLEYRTAWYFHHAVIELNFLEEVGKWHQDLEAAIIASKVFQSFDHITPERKDGYYLAAIEVTLQFCKEHGLDLIADDRTMQMVSEPGWTGYQYGTDALLLDLLEKDKISPDQYTHCFMKLVEWRYRFLVPDDRVLLYLAKQYKHRPLGSELETIADYGRHCMEDQGLLLGPEDTDPPKPLGAVFYFRWIDRWSKLLCNIWTNEDFDPESRLATTRKVFGQAIPPPPKGLLPEFRERLGVSEEIKILSAIIQFIMDSEQCLQLSELLHEAFYYFGITNEDRQTIILRDGFQLYVRIALSDDFRQRLISSPEVTKALSERNLTYEEFISNQLKKNLARLLVAYYGSQNIIRPSPFSDLMEEYGLIDGPIEESDTDGGFPHSEILSKGCQAPIERGETTVSAVGGSIFKIAWPEEGKEEVAFLHDMLYHVDIRIRMEAFQKLMIQDQLAEPTRIKLKGLKEPLASDLKAQWEPSAYSARQAVMKDFRYARKHVKTALLYQISNKELVGDAIENLFFPDIATAWAEAPPVVTSPEQNPETFKKNAKAEFKQSQKEGNQTENALNQYMEQFGFVSIAPPLDAWSLMQSMRIYPIESDQDAKDFFETVIHWGYAQDDPLALVVVWQILLGAGSSAEEKVRLKGNEFRTALTSLFIDIAVPEYRSGIKKENVRRRFLDKAWEARIHLSRHYLRYLELEAGNQTDQQRVLEAWWMAQKAMEALLDAMGTREIEEKTSLLEKLVIPEWIIKATLPTKIQHHLFYLPKAVQTADRYCTFAAKQHLPAAIMAFIAPTAEDLIAPGFVSMTMTDEIRDGMIGLLESPDDLALAHLPLEKDSALALLWNRSLTRSIPSFLRAYYKDNIEFVGKRKMKLLQEAEIIAKPDYPEEVLKELVKHVNEPLVFHALLAFEIATLKLKTEGKMIPALKTVLEKPGLLRELVNLDQSLGPLAAASLAQILPLLHTREEQRLAHAIEKQLLEIDWNLLRKYAEVMIERVIFVALLGAGNDLFKKLLEMGKKNKEFNDGLRMVKEILENYLSQIPVSHRERVRYLIRKLEAIPEIRKP